MGVAFHHWRKGNHHGAAVLLDEGIRRLRPFAPRCQQVDVDALLGAALAARARLDELGPERMSSFDLADAPRVTIVGR